MVAILVVRSAQNIEILYMIFHEIRKSYRGSSIDASCKMLLYLVKWFQRRRILEIDQPETRIAYGGHAYKRIGIK